MIPHAPLLSGVDEREAVRQLMLLDPCSAWRADLADAGHAEPMDEALADQWLLWLQIATVFDRLRSLPVAARAAYARSTTTLWETAARVTGAARFARVGAVMAAWEGAAPELAGFRELLWAVEQGEAEGALRVSICGLARLQRLVDGQDLRPAYTGAQLARALRTAGFLDMAKHQLRSSMRVAEANDDSWLDSRVALGLAVLHQTTGNYPAARSAFLDVVHDARSHRDILLAAHIGVVSATLTLQRFDEAISHGWEALRLVSNDIDEQIEVLAMMADIALEVGHFDLAFKTCAYALTLRPRRRRRYFFERGAVVSAAMLGDQAVTSGYLAALEKSAAVTTNLWERALSDLVLGKVFGLCDDDSRSREYLAHALSIAQKHGFHEIEWKAEQSISELLCRASEKTRAGTSVNQRELHTNSMTTLARIASEAANSWLMTRPAGCRESAPSALRVPAHITG